MLRNLLDINMGNLVLVDKLVLELDGKSGYFMDVLMHHYSIQNGLLNLA
jgi:hypothetical protein